jgi:hypothetical protein
MGHENLENLKAALDRVASEAHVVVEDVLRAVPSLLTDR